MGDIQSSRFPEPFNQREVDILGLIKQGLSNQEIAHKLFLSLATVKWYNHNIFNKLGVNSRTQAIEKAQEYGLIEQIAIPSISTTLRLKHNLPARPNSFIGRKQELTSLRRLLQTNDIRLVTILGPNGVGKTRLSLELAHQLTPNFRDGAYFVSLAPLNDPALVASAIAHTFGIRETSGHTLQETLADSLPRTAAAPVAGQFRACPARRLAGQRAAGGCTGLENPGDQPGAAAGLWRTALPTVSVICARPSKFAVTRKPAEI